MSRNVTRQAGLINYKLFVVRTMVNHDDELASEEEKLDDVNLEDDDDDLDDSAIDIDDDDDKIESMDDRDDL